MALSSTPRATRWSDFVRGSQPGVIGAACPTASSSVRPSSPGYGVLLSMTPRSIASNGDVIFDAAFDTDGNDRERDQERLLLYSNGGFQSIAQLGEPAGSKFVVDLRGIAVDDLGQVTYQISFNDWASRPA